ncbi:ring finger protein 112 L homeolog [Xenopus laevis]|uniref:LOC432253 protein n=2 Tax=Xenopus laevis TaxID=8355 RepID=Q2VPQ0_XENLA|nr:ring finger protein 112 L homeolog [Xenopus laevis]AAI08431.1 LOC432253 protein [Xenopus laevis]
MEGPSRAAAGERGGRRGSAAQSQNRRGRRRQRKPKNTPEAGDSGTSSGSAPHPQYGADCFSSLTEDITCSICLDDLTDPVYITCGHTFCRNCITTHWGTSQGYLCPECRAVCPRNQIVPDYRLGNLISKIKQGIKKSDAMQENLTAAEPDHPIQLVWTDVNGRLSLDLSGAHDCFLNTRYSNYPVFILCIIGEKRRGKSFLMNYIMRALRSMEMDEEISLGADDEPLKGFKWSPGTETTTKGIWMWNRPFLLNHKGGKIAVFLLDTEGSLDIESDRETCIKLSALSLFISSHLIFNVASNLKETELDYMEMYMNMGEECGPKNLQHLDILVRDWYHSKKWDRDVARSYISREIEKLEKLNSYPKVLWSLKSNQTRCFLLPHPGKGITGESEGRLQDMDEDFQESLRSYVSKVVKGICTHIKTNIDGELLTSAHVFSMLQEFTEVLNLQIYGFSSPMEMFYAIKNQKLMGEIENEFQDFLKNQSSLTLPPTMRVKVSQKFSELLEKFMQFVQGSNTSSHDAMLKDLEVRLLEIQEKFCNDFTTRFTMNAVGVGITAGFGVCGVLGATAARGTAMLAAQPVVAVGERAVAMEIASGAVSMLKTGMTAMLGRFFR